MIEVWKELEGYEDYYEISNTGKLSSLSRVIERSNGRQQSIHGKIMKGSINRDGYVRVTLSKLGRTESKFLHVLVAKAWVRNPNNLPEVNHKDEIKINNASDNLEWCTRSYQMEYSMARNWEVLTPHGAYLDIFNLNKFCKENNLDPSAMSKVARGKSKSHKGYIVWSLDF